MYTDIPLWLSLVMIVGGLAALAWSSDAFVDGASRVARAFGISPFIIGMVVIGFGTSAPELFVSAVSGLTGHANLSLGNAYGSCIFNIAVILGVSALVHPLIVRPSVAFFAGPVLALIAVFSLWVLRDGSCNRMEAAMLLVAFSVVMPAYCWYDQHMKNLRRIARAERGDDRAPSAPAPAAKDGGRRLVGAFLKLFFGLALLIVSSHCLVWGAVDLARLLGVSDLVIGLTVIAAGTSLPELASAVASARRRQHEFVIGNIIGSNIFNTLAVVGLACVISPVESFSPYVLSRDLPLVAGLSLTILVFGFNGRKWSRPGVVNRFEAAIWISVFLGYTALMFSQELSRGDARPARDGRPAAAEVGGGRDAGNGA
jgi:cation:H+ antiporter